MQVLAPAWLLSLLLYVLYLKSTDKWNIALSKVFLMPASSLPSINMSGHAPYCWLAPSLFWYSAQIKFSKTSLKKYKPAFKLI